MTTSTKKRIDRIYETELPAWRAAWRVFGLKRVPVELDESPGALSLSLYAPFPAGDAVRDATNH